MCGAALSAAHFQRDWNSPALVHRSWTLSCNEGSGGLARPFLSAGTNYSDSGIGTKGEIPVHDLRAAIRHRFGLDDTKCNHRFPVRDFRMTQMDREFAPKLPA